MLLYGNRAYSDAKIFLGKYSSDVRALEVLEEFVRALNADRKEYRMPLS